MRPLLRLAIASLVALAAVRGAAAQQGEVRLRRPMPSPQADSLVARIFTSDVAEVRRMVTLWREREQALITAMRAVPESDFPTRRRLAEEIGMHTRDAFAMMSAIEARCVDVGRTVPAGYLGLNLESSGDLVNGEVRVTATVVRSIEPGSPAERSGLRPDDRVLRIGDVEASRIGAIGAQLVPGRALTVRVERDGVPREFTLTVAKRPEGFGEACGEFRSALLPMRIPGRVVVREELSPGSRRVIVEARDSIPRTEHPEEVSVFLFGPGPDVSSAKAFFAGAEFRELDEGWREVLGVREGVIVSAVAQDTPAAASGLRSGDVVTALGGKAVATPVELVRMLGRSDETEVKLSIIRARERRTVTMKLGRR